MRPDTARASGAAHATAPLALATLVAALSLPARGSSGGFSAGDLALYSPYAHNGGPGISLVNPVSGVVTPLFGPTVVTPGDYTRLAYDAFTDRVLFLGSIGGPEDVYSIDSSGVATSLGMSGQSLILLSATGDGRIYYMQSSWRIGWRDASGGLHDLLDTSGAGAWHLPGTYSYGVTTMAYDRATNALYFASGQGIGTCPSGSYTASSVWKVPLSADGTRQEGAVLCQQVDVVPSTGNNYEVVQDLGAGPAGSMILVVDDNSNGMQPRMQRIDKQTLAITPWAQNGPYTGAAATNGGCYSTLRGEVVVLDTFDNDLRAFPEGATGSGTLLGTTGLSPASGSGEITSMIQIGPPSGQLATMTLTVDVAQVSVSQGGVQTLRVGAPAAEAGGVYLIVGSTTGWTPPFLFADHLLPITYDTYTLEVLQAPNGGTRGGFLGVLDAQAAATATIGVPAATSPALIGLRAWHCALRIDLAGAIVRLHSPPVSLELVP